MTYDRLNKLSNDADRALRNLIKYITGSEYSYDFGILMDKAEKLTSELYRIGVEHGKETGTLK